VLAATAEPLSTIALSQKSGVPAWKTYDPGRAWTTAKAPLAIRSPMNLATCP
jgi:hypothetical protein